MTHVWLELSEVKLLTVNSKCQWNRWLHASSSIWLTEMSLVFNCCCHCLTFDLCNPERRHSSSSKPSSSLAPSAAYTMSTPPHRSRGSSGGGGVSGGGVAGRPSLGNSTSSSSSSSSSNSKTNKSAKEFSGHGRPPFFPKVPHDKMWVWQPQTWKERGGKRLVGGGACSLFSSSTSKSLSLFLQPRGGRCLISADLSASDWHSFGGRGRLGVGRIFKIKMWSPRTFGRVFIGS